MRLLVVGAGGVGSAFAAIASRRPFFEQLVLADLDRDRARRTVDRLGDPRIVAGVDRRVATRRRSRTPSAPIGSTRCSTQRTRGS